MSTEIERKWIVQDVPSDALQSGVPLRQGYIARDGDVEVRVRITPTAATLTIKAGSGMSRTEVETPLTAEAAHELWPLSRGRGIEKTRYRIPVNGMVAELDMYEGQLAGLCTVEVEFPSPGAADAFVAPPWFGIEVTGDDRWSNAALAERGIPE